MKKSQLITKAQDLGLDVDENTPKREIEAMISNREQADEASSNASQEPAQEEEFKEGRTPHDDQRKTTNTGHEPFEPKVEGYSYGVGPDTEGEKLPQNHPEEDNG